MGNSYFKKQSAVFNCRYCGRSTRDTTGDNGSFELCQDCNEGSLQENGCQDSSDPELKAQYERKMRECFQRSVNKGGAIEGYTAITEPAKKQKGRPALPPEQQQTERVEMRCTKAQKEKLESLGGVQWLRDSIDRASEA